MTDTAWEELANSDRHDYLGTGRREDQLDDPAWLAGYLRRWRLGGAGASAASLVPELKRLRAVLQEEAQAIAGVARVGSGRFRKLNAYLGRAPLLRKLEINDGRPSLRLEHARRTSASILADIAASFADMVVRGETERIKICGNADCRWAFYDRTRNKSRRWCGPTCGNLMKVRRFRSRRKTARPR